MCPFFIAGQFEILKQPLSTRVFSTTLRRPHQHTDPRPFSYFELFRLFSSNTSAVKVASFVAASCQQFGGNSAF